MSDEIMEMMQKKQKRQSKINNKIFINNIMNRK